MYEITGIITFWILRISLVVLLIWLIVDFNRLRQSITRTVKTSETTWTRRPLTISEGIKEIPWYGYVAFILVLVLVILSWWTLIIF